MVLKFKQISPYSCKTYLIELNKEIILIDPVLDHFKDYLLMIKENHYTLKYLIDTHTHADHISCCSALKDIIGCNYIMYENAFSKCVNIRVKDNQVMKLLGDTEFRFLHTPGHTMDSVSIIIEDKLLTGDVLFLDDGGAGRDDLPGGNPEDHWNSLQKILLLNENLTVYPAHDYRNRKPSSLLDQKKNNPYLKKKNKKEFINYINDLKLGPADWMKDVLKANYTCAQDPRAAWIPIDTPACEVKGTIDPSVNEIEVDIITNSELKKYINSDTEYLLLDVREPEELKGELGKIDGVMNIPLLSVTKKLDEIKKYMDKEIFLICRSGSRAYTAGQLLKKSGFKKVRVLKGGMLEWS